MNIKQFAAPVLLALTASAAQAHEVWVERDGSGPARIYLGEPEAPLPEGGDPEFDHLKAPRLIPATRAALTRRAGYLEVALAPGDVRVQDDAVFAPWGDADKKQGVIYFARAGRAEARAVMPLEIAPTTANGDRFVLTHDGKPQADAKVTIISPEKWSKVVVTDAEGRVTVPLREKGRYLLSATRKAEGRFDTALGEVAILNSVTTTTFVLD